MEKLQRFEDYHNKNKDINDILKELEQQKKEINKQIHLFKVLEIGSIVQGLIDDGTLKNHEVSAIMFHHNYDYDYGNELICDFKDLDGHDSHKSYLPGNFIDHINDTFRILNGFSEENIKEGFKENIDIVVPITENFKEKFIEMMLSSELKVILNYNQLHIGLPLNSNKSIKLKV